MNKFNRVMPRKGSVETIIDRLYEYINPVDSNWIKNIKPASCEDIKKLESICGLKDVGIKVPKSYLEYLKCMGESDGELLSQMVGGNKNIKIILNLYDDIISYDKDDDILYCEGDEIGINPYKLYFSLTILDIEYYFKFNEDGTYIITSDYDESRKISPYSSNFEKLLFVAAHKKYEARYFKNQVKFITTPNNYQKTLKKLGVQDIFILLEDFLLKNKFNKVWFSDNYTFIAYRGDISFVIYKHNTLFGKVYGDDKLEIKKIAEKLCKILNLEILD